MPLRYMLICGVLLLVTGCATIGGKFCTSNGYEKDTPGYERCTANYQANREFFEYCASKQGLVLEGQPLQQCLINGRILKEGYEKDRRFCEEQALHKYASIFSQSKREDQPTLTPQGTIVIGAIELNAPYSPEEQLAVAAPYIEQCMGAHGWRNAYVWQEGRNNTTIAQTTSILSRLNRQPLTVPVPQHASVDLFAAAADGNLSHLEGLIQSGVPADIRNYQGYAAIHVAARRGQLHIVQALVEKYRINPDDYGAHGETPTSLAYQGNQVHVANYLRDYKERLRREEQLQAINEAVKAATEAYEDGKGEPSKKTEKIRKTQRSVNKTLKNLEGIDIHRVK